MFCIILVGPMRDLFRDLFQRTTSIYWDNTVSNVGATVSQET